MGFSEDAAACIHITAVSTTTIQEFDSKISRIDCADVCYRGGDIHILPHITEIIKYFDLCHGKIGAIDEYLFTFPRIICFIRLNRVITRVNHDGYVVLFCTTVSRTCEPRCIDDLRFSDV